MVPVIQTNKKKLGALLMARSRNIKPGFFTNDILGELPPLARILFAGMWCHADREGRLHDRPKRLKAEILPYDECDVNGLIQCLHDAGMVLRYVVDGIGYIQCVNFTKHQNPHVKEAPSEIPAPESTGQAPDKNSEKTADSLLLIPDSLNPSKALSAKADAGYPDEFEKTWQAYPRRLGDNPKRKAFRAWSARVKEGSTADEIHAGVVRYASFVRHTGKENTETVKHAATFFGPDCAFKQPWRVSASPVIDTSCQRRLPGGGVCGMPGRIHPVYGYSCEHCDAKEAERRGPAKPMPEAVRKALRREAT